MEERNIPKLRFLEFKSIWEKKKIADFGDVVTGSTPSTSNREYYDGEYLFVSPADIDKNRYVYTTSTTLTKEGFEKCRKIKKGAPLFVCIGSTIGKVGQATVDCATNQQINSVICNSKNIDDFVFNLLELKSKRIALLAGNQAVPIVNKTTFQSYSFFIPDKPEQQKIASFLSAVDTKIEQLTRKKDLLEQYKKGVMQKLFPAPSAGSGTTGKAQHPELRFKDKHGNNFPDWEVTTFGEIARFINGKAYKQAELLDEGKYEVLRVGNLFSNNDWYYSDLELKEDKYIDQGDLIYAWSASFGPFYWEGDKAIYHYHIWKVEPFESVAKDFLYYLFEYDKDKILSESQGATMFHITKGNMESREIFVPSKKEQLKISKFIQKIDRKIKLALEELEKAQTFKKGLLQHMFV